MPKITVISKEQYSYIVPDSYRDPMPMQQGGTCGLCAANHALNLLHAYKAETDRPDGVLVEAALQFPIDGDIRPLTYTGEIFHPEEFTEFINNQVGKKIAHCINVGDGSYDFHSIIIDTINHKGYVLVPFNVSLSGFPENPPADSKSRAHWCLIAGYREEDPNQLLAMHWNQTFNMYAKELESSNLGPWPYVETDLEVIIRDTQAGIGEIQVGQKIKQHYDGHHDKYYATASGGWVPARTKGPDGRALTVGRFIFTNAMYHEVNKLTGKIITLLPQ